MKQKRLTGSELARQLGISRSQLWRLKRQCPDEAPKPTDPIEKWRSFCLRHAVEPELISRLLERLER
jgi:transposase-like protein